MKNTASVTFETINKSDKLQEIEKIQEKYNEILNRHQQLLVNCVTKRKHLEDSRNLHLFIRECSEVLFKQVLNLLLYFLGDNVDEC